MSDWSNLLEKAKKLSYDEIVAEGKIIVDDVLASVAKHSDKDSAPIMLICLAAYTTNLDNNISELEMQLMQDVVGIREKDFRGFVNLFKDDKKLVRELKEICLGMSKAETEKFAYMLALIFAVDGEISAKESDFLNELFI